MRLPHIADINSGEWIEHYRFKGIQMKYLLTPADNALANVNAVRVPPGGVIGRHQHSRHVETIYVVTGRAVLTLEQTDVPLRDGQMVVIPPALEHSLRNESVSPVQLVAFFTPPLT